jgi:hypothetical protein
LSQVSFDYISIEHVRNQKESMGSSKKHCFTARTTNGFYFKICNNEGEELTLADAAEAIARHPNSAQRHLVLAELHSEAGSERRMRSLAREALLLDPLGADTQCRARSADGEAGDCE